MNKCVVLAAVFSLALSCRTGKAQSECQGNKIEVAESFTDSSSSINDKFPSVNLMFLGIFEDTLIVYYNHKEIYRFAAFKKDYPATSSDYTGHTISLRATSNKKALVVKMMNHKICTLVYVDNTFPLITLQRYGDKFYFNRRHKMVLK